MKEELKELLELMVDLATAENKTNIRNESTTCHILQYQLATQLRSSDQLVSKTRSDAAVRPQPKRE